MKLNNVNMGELIGHAQGVGPGELGGARQVPIPLDQPPPAGGVFRAINLTGLIGDPSPNTLAYIKALTINFRLGFQCVPLLSEEISSVVKLKS